MKLLLGTLTALFVSTTTLAGGSGGGGVMMSSAPALSGQTLVLFRELHGDLVSFELAMPTAQGWNRQRVAIEAKDLPSVWRQSLQQSSVTNSWQNVPERHE